MKNSVTIPRNPDRKKSRDYEFLREQGLKHVEQLSSELWTDYNIHDPGITLLELLCYAITDLGYRTSYEVKDLLADQSVPSPGKDKQFHTAREILTTNPVTMLDYRKLLIDVEGIRNAWLHPLEKTTPPLYLDCDRGTWETEPGEGHKEIHLKGLYDITLELEEDEEAGDLNEFEVKIDLYAEPDKNQEEEYLYIKMPDWSRWMNSGVIPGEMSTIKIKQIEPAEEDGRVMFDAKIEISAGGKIYMKDVAIEATDKDKTTSHIENRLNAESVIDQYKVKLEKALEIGWNTFHLLHENRGLCEDFEEFRALDVEEIGVCAEIEVENEAELERVLAEIYFGIEQHIAPPVYFYSLKEMMEKEIPTEEIFEGPPLDHGFLTNNELERAEIRKELHVSDILQIIMDVDGVKTVNDLMLNSSYDGKVLNSSIQWQYTVGEGRVPRFRVERSDIDLFKENLPYHVNSEKIERYLNEMEDMQRSRKLSSQEKYDFTVPEGKDRDLTRYTSIQQDLPLTYGMGDAGIPGPITDERRAQAKQLRAYLTFYDQLLVDYLAQLANLKNLFSFSNEVQATYYYQVLFEQPTDFGFPGPDPSTGVLFNAEGSPRIRQVIKDFIDFIKETESGEIDYDDERFMQNKWKKYWLEKEEAGETNFVKELDEMVEDKRTFHDRRNRFLDHLLARFGESFTDYVMLMYSRDSGPRTGDDLIEDKTQFLERYPIISASRGTAFNYKEEKVWDTENVSGFEQRVACLLGIECREYQRRTLACEAPDDPEECNKEGFHLVEHILLRPEQADDPMLPACPSKNCSDCPGYLDPYSFRVTLMVPYWPDRFRDMAFRKFMERTIRKEAPAHIHVKICWVNQEDMELFEEAYEEWLKAISKNNPGAETLRNKLRALIDALGEIRSEYPPATLHDFEDDIDDNPMLLDNTAL